MNMVRLFPFFYNMSIWLENSFLGAGAGLRNVTSDDQTWQNCLLKWISLITQNNTEQRNWAAVTPTMPLFKLFLDIHHNPPNAMTVFLFQFLPPHKKLWESDVFSRVCLSVHSWGVPMWPLPKMDWNSLYRDPLLLAPSPDIRPHCTGPSVSDIWGPRLETRSNLFTWGSSSQMLTSGGYCSTYGWHVGGMHPTITFSCRICFG